MSGYVESLEVHVAQARLDAAGREYAAASQRLANEQEIGATQMRPSMLLRPRLSIDGNQWCALYGENLQDGVAGFGDSPEAAYADFDKEWRKPLPTKEGSR